jgi:F-type H+-transporting ATPase subunit b
MLYAIRFGALMSAVIAAALWCSTASAQPEAHPPAATHDSAAGHDDGHTAGHGEGHDVNLSPMTIDPDLAIYTLVVFIVLIIVLAKFAWKPIAEGLDAREKGIADNIAAAQRSNDEAKALLAQYEQRLAAAQDEVRGILDEARRDAEHTQQEILAKAQAEAENTRQRAVRDIESASAAAMKELAEHGSQLAVALAGKIVQAELKSDGHARLIQDALAKFPAPHRN